MSGAAVGEETGGATVGVLWLAKRVAVLVQEIGVVYLGGLRLAMSAAALEGENDGASLGDLWSVAGLGEGIGGACLDGL